MTLKRMIKLMIGAMGKSFHFGLAEVLCKETSINFLIKHNPLW